MLNRTFFTDTEHKDKYFRNFISDVVTRFSLEEKEEKKVQGEYILFPLNWHDKVNRSSGIIGF